MPRIFKEKKSWVKGGGNKSTRLFAELMMVPKLLIQRGGTVERSNLLLV